MRRAIMAIVLGLLPPGALCAQSTWTTVIQTRSLNLDAELLGGDSLGAGGADISQTSIRTTITAFVTPALSVVVSGGAGLSDLQGFAGASEAQGLTDTRVKLFYRIAGGRVLLGAGVVAPTGLHSLEPDELSTAAGVWSPLLGFPLKRLGEGWGGDVSGSVAFPLGDRTTLGLGAGYYARGEYDLSANPVSQYRPGNEISSTAAFDFIEERTGLRLALALRSFAADRLNGADYIDQGDQIEGTARFWWRGDRLGMALTGHAVAKGDNRFFVSAARGAATAEDPGGRSVFFGGRLSWQASGRLSIFGEATGGLFTDYEAALVPVNGRSWTAGPGLGWQPGPNLETSVRFALTGGSAEDGGSYDGYDVLAMVAVKR